MLARPEPLLQQHRHFPARRVMDREPHPGGSRQAEFDAGGGVEGVGIGGSQGANPRQWRCCRFYTGHAIEAEDMKAVLLFQKVDQILVHHHIHCFESRAVKTHRLWTGRSGDVQNYQAVHAVGDKGVGRGNGHAAAVTIAVIGAGLARIGGIGNIEDVQTGLIIGYVNQSAADRHMHAGLGGGKAASNEGMRRIADVNNAESGVFISHTGPLTEKGDLLRSALCENTADFARIGRVADIGDDQAAVAVGDVEEVALPGQRLGKTARVECPGLHRHLRIAKVKNEQAAGSAGEIQYGAVGERILTPALRAE